MTPPVAYDCTRLFLGPLQRTPRGIDRVDMAYAEHVFTTNPQATAVLPTAWGVRCFARERALAGLSRLRALWAEAADPNEDPAWLALRARLLEGDEQQNAQRPARPAPQRQATRLLSLLRATGLSTGRAVRRAVPPAAVYLNVGQIGLAIPCLTRWLDARRDVKPALMLHDVIPLETPEYVEPQGVWGHNNMVAVTARYAGGLIVTTGAARGAIERELARRGRDPLPAFERPLPPSEPFGPGVAADPALERCTYFVACATLEPRKNIELLSEIWKRLCAEQGEAAPHLVIVGAKGWTGERIAARLQRAPGTVRRLHIVHGLSTPSLARLIAGARAMLSPSFVEGFGLPIVEAQAIGTPVIASDIPSHREIACAGTTLIDPLDGPGWKAAVERAALGPSRRAARNDAQDWASYFAAFDAWLAEFAAARGTHRAPRPDINQLQTATGHTIHA
ncbi:MAG: glycosyltransferase family 4 protein [Beijerinckiaceae bacterium]